MVVKTITITEEAYNMLKCLKRNEQSFSEIIIEVSKDKKCDLSKFFGILKNRGKELDILKEKVKDYRNNFTKESKKRMKLRNSKDKLLSDPNDARVYYKILKRWENIKDDFKFPGVNHVSYIVYNTEKNLLIKKRISKEMYKFVGEIGEILISR